MPSRGYQRGGVGGSGDIAASAVPSKSTISRIRYGFSLWHWGHRILKTWDFRWDDSIPSFADACRLPTMAGTGMGALQCRHTTPRKVWRSASIIIFDPRRELGFSIGVNSSYSKGPSRVQSPGKKDLWKCENGPRNDDNLPQLIDTMRVMESPLSGATSHLPFPLSTGNLSDGLKVGKEAKRQGHREAGEQGNTKTWWGGGAL